MITQEDLVAADSKEEERISKPDYRRIFFSRAVNYFEENFPYLEEELGGHFAYNTFLGERADKAFQVLYDRSITDGMHLDAALELANNELFSGYKFIPMDFVNTIINEYLSKYVSNAFYYAEDLISEEQRLAFFKEVKPLFDQYSLSDHDDPNDDDPEVMECVRKIKKIIIPQIDIKEIIAIKEKIDSGEIV